MRPALPRQAEGLLPCRPALQQRHAALSLAEACRPGALHRPFACTAMQRASPLTPSLDPVPPCLCCPAVNALISFWNFLS